MTLYCAHYLVTSFSLTVWTRSPLMTIILYYLFQTIYFLVVPHAQLNGVNFWLLQSAIVFVGTMSGAFFVWAARRKRLLAFKGGYQPQWNVFLVWLAVFILSQLPYAFLPLQAEVFVFDTPLYPWGLLLMIVAHVACNLVACWSLLEKGNDQMLPEYLIAFFVQWTVLVFLLEVVLFFSYVIAECYATLIAGGFVLALTIVNLIRVLSSHVNKDENDALVP